MTFKNAVKYLDVSSGSSGSGTSAGGKPENQAPENGEIRGQVRLAALCRVLDELAPAGNDRDVAATWRVVRFSPTRVGRLSAQMCASVLRTAGFKVGLFDLSTGTGIRERVSVNGEPISHEELVKGTELIAEAVRRVTPGLTSMPADPSVTRRQRPALLHGHPFSQADLWLSLAYLTFRDAGCDFALLIRTGTAHADPTLLGLPVGKAAALEVVAGIVERSGVTPASACTDACAGIRPSARDGFMKDSVGEAVVCALDNVQSRHVTEACSKAGIRLSVPLRAETHVLGQTLHRTRFSYRGKDGFTVNGGSEVALTAALCSLEVCYALRRTGAVIPTDRIREGLLSLSCGELLEPLSHEPDILLDALLCPGDATATLTDLFRLRSPEGRFWLIADAAYLPDLRNALRKLPAACQPGVLYCCGNVVSDPSDPEVPGIPDKSRSRTDRGDAADGGAEECDPFASMPVDDLTNIVFDRAPASVLADFLRECHPEDLLLVMGGSAFVAEAKRVFKEKM